MGNGAVGLAKGLKELPGLIRRDADAGVSYGEADADRSIKALFLSDLYADTTGFSEFYRITHQVVQHLPQAR